MTSVALVVLDTLRKDYFDEYFEWLPGTTYDHAWSTSHWTVPAHASLFSGHHPSEIGVYGSSPVFDYGGKSVVEQLSAAGYRTRGYSCNPYITETFGFNRGFDDLKRNWSSKRLDDDLFDWGDFESDHRFEGPLRFPEAVARVVLSDAKTIPSLKHGLSRKMFHDNIGPFTGDKGASRVYQTVKETNFNDREFYFINLMEAHGPYNPPEEYRTCTVSNSGLSFADLVSHESIEPEVTRQGYDDSVRYLSDIYREIFEELAGAFDVVFTVGDHGEMLGERGHWGHNFGVFAPLTRVPFNVYAESFDSISADRTVSLLDVHRTILDIAGANPGESRGKNLFEDTGHTDHYLTEYHGITHDQTLKKLREHDVSEQTIREYDSPLRGIATPEDYYGFETVDGFEKSGTSTEDDPRELLASLKQDLPIRDLDDSVEYSDEMKSRLEQLGYL